MEGRKEFLERIDAKDAVSKNTAVSDNEVKNDNTNRTHVKPGIKVLIVQKQHQKTGELTEGIVKDILTSSKNHHRGIKVRLQSGIVGRVQKIL